MGSDKSKMKLIPLSLGIIALVLALVCWIDVSSFKKDYRASVVSSYSVLGGEPVRNIEYALKYGKSLQQFFGMETLLSGVKEKAQSIKDVQLVLPDGTVKYALANDPKLNLTGETLKAYMAAGLAEMAQKTAKQQNVIEQQGDLYILLPIKGENEQLAASLVLMVSGSLVSQEVARYYEGMLSYGIKIGIGSMGAYLLLYLFFRRQKETPKGHLMKGVALLLTVVIGGQLALGFVNYGLLKTRYIETTKTNTAFVAKSIQKELNGVVAKGVSVDQFGDVELWLNTVTNAVPEIQSLYITDMRGEVLYKTKNLIFMQEELIDPEYNYNLPLIRDSAQKKYLINVVLSRDFHKEKLQKNVVQAAVIMLAVCLVIGGGTNYQLKRFEPKGEDETYEV